MTNEGDRASRKRLRRGLLIRQVMCTLGRKGLPLVRLVEIHTDHAAHLKLARRRGPMQANHKLDSLANQCPMPGITVPL